MGELMKDYEKKYTIHVSDINEKERGFWISKKLDDVKKDIKDMIPFYDIKNIDSITIELQIKVKNETCD